MTPCPKQKPYRCKSLMEYRKLQKAVIKRDGFRCVHCNKWILDYDGSFFPPHHIIFKSQGGSDTMENLETVCMTCHDRLHGR